VLRASQLAITIAPALRSFDKLRVSLRLDELEITPVPLVGPIPFAEERLQEVADIELRTLGTGFLFLDPNAAQLDLASGSRDAPAPVVIAELASLAAPQDEASTGPAMCPAAAYESDIATIGRTTLDLLAFPHA
jgi:hypothetical protein